jgi:hypothetical protein
LTPRNQMGTCIGRSARSGSPGTAPSIASAAWRSRDDVPGGPKWARTGKDPDVSILRPPRVYPLLEVRRREPSPCHLPLPSKEPPRPHQTRRESNDTSELPKFSDYVKKLKRHSEYSDAIHGRVRGPNCLIAGPSGRFMRFDAGRA